MWLDMYLEKRKKGNKSFNTNKEVMYWRKARAINNWILEKQYNKYWLDEYWDEDYAWNKPISVDELKELLSILDTLVIDKTFTDYTEDYIDRMKKELPEIIESLWEDEEFVYSASR